MKRTSLTRLAAERRKLLPRRALARRLDLAVPGTMREIRERRERLIALRIPEAMNSALLRAAHERKCTVSDVVRGAIEKELKR